MSFNKLNLCESTQVAIDVFCLFRSGLVNMVKTYDEHLTHTGYMFYKNVWPDESLEKQDEFGSYDMSRVTEWLKGDYFLVKVHDIEKAEMKDEGPRHYMLTRVVSIVIDDRKNCSETLFTVIVSSKPSCQMKWQMSSAQLLRREMSGKTTAIDLSRDSSPFPFHGHSHVHDEVANLIGDYVRWTPSK